MSDPFVKVYSTLLDSSLWWGEDAATRLVWITLLVAADHEGVYRGTVPGLAGRARVTIDEARHAIFRLQQPDDESRTKAHGGRRIEVIDGIGFRLINYEKYRDKRSPKQIQDAAYKATERARRRASDSTPDNPDMSGCQHQILDPRSEILDPRLEIQSERGSAEGAAPPTPPAPPAAGAAPSPSRDANGNAQLPGPGGTQEPPSRRMRIQRPARDTGATEGHLGPKKRGGRSAKTLLPEDFAPNAEHATIAKERGLDLAEVFANFRDWCVANGARKVDWNATLRKWIRSESPRHGAARAQQSRGHGNHDVYKFIFDQATKEGG